MKGVTRMSSSALLRLEALRNLCLESRMRGNVPVRFGRGRLDSLGNRGLAAYLIGQWLVDCCPNSIRDRMCKTSEDMKPPAYSHRNPRAGGGEPQSSFRI